MPNWCANNVTITHDDPAKLNELVDAYKRGELMEHFMPTQEIQMIQPSYLAKVSPSRLTVA